jgi:hypothetical protein
MSLKNLLKLFGWLTITDLNNTVSWLWILACNNKLISKYQKYTPLIKAEIESA